MVKKIVIKGDVKAGEWNFLKKEEQMKICPVCSTEILEGSLIFDCPYCGNVMHRRCVEPWLRSHGMCPICKRPLSQSPQTSEGG